MRGIGIIFIPFSRDEVMSALENKSIHIMKIKRNRKLSQSKTNSFVSVIVSIV